MSKGPGCILDEMANGGMPHSEDPQCSAPNEGLTMSGSHGLVVVGVEPAGGAPSLEKTLPTLFPSRRRTLEGGVGVVWEGGNSKGPMSSPTAHKCFDSDGAFLENPCA